MTTKRVYELEVDDVFRMEKILYSVEYIDKRKIYYKRLLLDKKIGKWNRVGGYLYFGSFNQMKVEIVLPKFMEEKQLKSA